MQTKIREAKAALRKQIRAHLKNLSPEDCARASVLARALLVRQTVWKRARSALFFAPMPGELDVWPLLVEALSRGMTVALPRFLADENVYVACQVKDVQQDVQPGYFGIREPVERCAPIASNRLDLILVPGVAFDLVGHRLGWGKGYYDQLLAMVHGTTCGVAFDEQVVSEVPVELHDARLSCLLTPTRWVEI